MKPYNTHMVEKRLTFEYPNRITRDLEKLPITEAVLGDSQYTRWVLPSIMEYGLPDLGRDKRKKGQLMRTAVALSKVGRGRHWWATEPVFSVFDLASMSDQELLDSHVLWLGPKRIGYFRQAWQNFQALRMSTLLPQ